MSNTTHTITLTSKATGVKETFDVIKRGAAEDAAALKALGKDGAAGLKQVDDAAKQSGRSMGEFGKNAREVGAGLGVLVAASALAGRSAVDQERSIASLQRTYGDATDQLVNFADELQRTTTFSNDAARDAEQIFGTLARNYGLTADQIQTLTQRTADLAAATGFSLPDAAERVAAAIRGEAESAEALGLTMNQQAIDRNNLTQTMSNQEAAQFRLNALYEQSAFAEGAAAERADTLAGKTQQLVNRGQDLVQWAGAAIGPIGQVTSVLGSMALAAPLVGAGFGEVATAVGALTGLFASNTVAAEAETVAETELAAATALTGEAAIGAELASAGLLATLGPLGLVAAAAAAAVGIYELVKGHHDESDAAKDADLATQGLVRTLHDLNAAGNPFAGTAMAWSTTIDTAFANLPDAIQKVKDAQTALTGTDQPTAIGPDDKELQALETQLEDLERVSGEYAEVQQALNDIYLDSGTGAELAQKAAKDLFDQYARDGDVSHLVTGLLDIDKALGQFDIQANQAAGTVRTTIDAYKKQQETLKDNIQLLEDYATAISSTSTESQDKLQRFAKDIDTLVASDPEAAAVRLQFWVDQLNAGKTSLDAVEDAAHRAAIGVGEFDRATQKQIADDNSAGAIAKAAIARGLQIEKEREFVATSVESILATDRLAKGTENWTRDLGAAGTGLVAVKIGLEAWTRDLGVAGTGLAALKIGQEAFNKEAGIAATVHKTAMDVVHAGVDELHAEAKAAFDAANALGVLDTYAKQLKPIDIGVSGGDKVTGTAANAQSAASALGSVLGLFSTIDAMGKSHGQAGSIADALIGKPGEWAALDDLVNQGRISITRYNEALEAGQHIQARTAEVEADLNVIRAKQLPLLDEADARYADLIDQISHMGAAEQTATLGFMDQTEALKAQNAVTLAAQAATKQLGENGEEAATKIIAGAVAADPVLEQMLTSIGLVARDHKGNLVVNFPNAESLNESVDGLTSSIDLLTQALIIVAAQNAAPTVTLSGVAGALDEISGLSGALDALDGKSITALVNVVAGDTSGLTVADLAGFEGGGIVSAAGGRLVRVNEGGQETATLPTGDTMWLPTGTTVWPHAASVMGNKKGPPGGGAPVFTNCSFVIQTANPQDFYRQLGTARVGGARR